MLALAMPAGELRLKFDREKADAVDVANLADRKFSNLVYKVFKSHCAGGSYIADYQRLMDEQAAEPDDNAEDTQYKLNNRTRLSEISPEKCTDISLAVFSKWFKANESSNFLYELRTPLLNRLSIKSRDSRLAVKQAQEKIDSLAHSTELLQCNGEPVHDISLIDQFPPTRDQGDRGICYAYASSALVEAALYRASGNRYTLSPAQAALAYMGHISPSDNKAKIQDLSKNIPFTNGGLVDETLKGILKLGWAVQVDPEKDELALVDFEGRARLVYVLSQGLNKLSQKLPSSQLDKAARSIEKLIGAGPSGAVMAGFKKRGFVAIDDKRLTVAGQRLNLGADCTSNPSKFEREVVRLLCNRTPIGIGFITSAATYSDDAGKTWLSNMESIMRYNGAHAVVLDKVSIDDVTGKLMFEARNSWKAGTSEISQISSARFTPQSLCSISSAQVLLTPDEIKRIGPVEFWPRGKNGKSGKDETH